MPHLRVRYKGSKLFYGNTDVFQVLIDAVIKKKIRGFLTTSKATR